MAFLHRHRGLVPYLLLAPGLLWLAIFFVAPLGFLGYQSLQSGSFDFGYIFDWNFGNYWDAIDRYHEHLIRSLVYAGLATVIALLISYPLVYWIAFRGGRWKNLYLLAIIAPFFVTYLIRTLAWQSILADSGFVVNVLRTLGILPDDGRLLATPVAVVAGLTYNFLPFMALPLYVALEGIDPRLLEAAQDLYASKVRTFLRVTLPLSLPGVFAGTLLTFIPAAGDFINAQLLGTPRQHMIGNVIQSKFLELIDYPAAASLSFVLMAAIIVLVAIYARSLGTEKLTRMTAVIRRHALTAYAICAFIYLLLPIAVVIAFSFNDPAGRFNYTWQGFTLDNWINWNAVPGLADSMVLSHRDRGDLEHRGDGSRNPDRARARPSPLPRAGRNQPARLRADGDARDRARRRAADALPAAQGPDRLPHDRDRAHHVHHQLRGRDREGAAGQLRPASRGGGDGPRRRRVDDFPEGDVAADRACDLLGASARVRALDRRLRDHATSTRVRRPRSRCSSGVRRESARPRRSMSSRPRSSCSRSPIAVTNVVVQNRRGKGAA